MKKLTISLTIFSLVFSLGFLIFSQANGRAVPATPAIPATPATPPTPGSPPNGGATPASPATPATPATPPNSSDDPTCVGIQVPTDYPTIQAGINAAQSGDTVCVAAGTYQEESIEIHGKDIALVGAGIGNTILDSLVGSSTPDVQHPEDHSAFDIRNVTSAAKIEGFTVKNAYYYGIHLIDASPVIQNNELTEHDSGGIKIIEDSQPAISYNVISLNGSWGIGHNAPLGGFEISHNTFVGNGDSGGDSAIIFNPVRHGNYMYPAEPITVRDNIFADGVIGVREANGTSNFTILNNLFYNQSEAHVRIGGTLYNTAEDINSLSYASDNLVADPLFVSSADYHLQEGSSAIGIASDGDNIGAY